MDYLDLIDEEDFETKIIREEMQYELEKEEKQLKFIEKGEKNGIKI